MSYANQAALAVDEAFTARLSACLCTEAQAAADDDPLANTILRNPSHGVAMFMPFVSTAPGFGDESDQSAIDDGMLLSAVQASWASVSATNTPPTPGP